MHCQWSLFANPVESGIGEPRGVLSVPPDDVERRCDVSVEAQLPTCDTRRVICRL